MKTIPLALLLGLALPLCLEAKEKPKAAAPPDTTAAEMQAIKGKLIDLKSTGPAPEGIISTELSGRDVQFFLSAYEIGGLETWLGEQAKKRGEADKVKAVGDALKSTQAEENELLANLARRKGMVLPEAPTKSATWLKLQERLGKTAGPAFDTAIMEQIGLATQQALDAYTAASASKDSDIKYFASQILPMVREKLALAQRLSGKPGGPGSKPGFRDSSPPPPPPATPAPAPKPSTPTPRTVVPATPVAKPSTPGAKAATPLAKAATPPSLAATPPPKAASPAAPATAAKTTPLATPGKAPAAAPPSALPSPTPVPFVPSK